MERLEEVQSSRSQQTNADWRQKIKLLENYSQYRQEFNTMLEPFPEMWDGHFGRISVAKHPINLVPGASAVHSAPYGAGPDVCKVQRIDIARMLEQKIIETPTTQRAAPIVFAQKRKVPCASVLTLEDRMHQLKETRPLYREWISVSNSLGNTECSPHKKPTAVIGKWKLTIRINIKPPSHPIATNIDSYACRLNSTMRWAHSNDPLM